MAPKRRNQDSKTVPSNPAKMARLTRGSARAGTAEVAIPKVYKTEPGLMEFLKKEAEMVREVEENDPFGRPPEPRRRYVSSTKPNQDPKPLYRYGVVARNVEPKFWYPDAPDWDNTRVAALPDGFGGHSFLDFTAGIAREGPLARIPWLDAPNRETDQGEGAETEDAEPPAPGNGAAEQTTGAPQQDCQTNEAAD